VVAGSGGAGLTAAVTAAARGLRTLLVEKTGLWGGTTALSGGVLWIPANPLMSRDGVPDSLDEALRYLAQIAGEPTGATSEGRRRAYLDAGPHLVEFLASRGFRWTRIPQYPDYYPELEGARRGRSLEGELFDGKRLGPWLKSLRRRKGPEPAAQSKDFDQLVLALRTLRGLIRTSRVFGRTWIWEALGRAPLSAGLSLVGQLMNVAIRDGVTVWLDTALRDLVVEEGRVAGVVLERGGKQITIRARRGVVLTTGGFARARDLRRRYQPVGDEWTSAIRSDTGDGLLAGLEAGAAAALMENAWWGPSFVSPDGVRAFSVWERSMPGSILVDTAGRRFVNESASYLDVGRTILERNQTVPTIPAWMVMDDRNRRHYPLMSLPPGRTPEAMVRSGFLVRAGSVEQLADAMAMDPAVLRETVDRFNGFARRGVDEDFGRGRSAYDRYYSDPRMKPNPNLAPIQRPPFWAIRIFPGDLGTNGGLLTDERARVLDLGGEPIKGLYAAGNTTATVMGRTYPGAGGTIGPAMVFAYLAAEDMTR